MISITVLVPLYTATLPAFYFALSRNEGSLRFPKRLRLLALLAAFTTGVIAIAGLPEWFRSLGSYLAAPMFDWSVGASTVLTFARDPRTISQFAILLGEVSNIAYVLMLIAMFRQNSDGLETGAPTSRLLNRATRAAVFAWGLVVVAVLLGLLLTPYTFYTIRQDVLQMGRTPPGFVYFFVRQLRTVLQQSCLFVAPYVVYKSQMGPIENAAPELLESGA